jgi:hypothetical protein
MDEQEPDKIVNLGEARGDKFLRELGKGDSAFAAGYRPAEELADWYLAGGYWYGDMLHAMAYSAAAQLFRDLPPQDAEAEVRMAFECIIKDLLRNGPHYGHEPY